MRIDWAFWLPVLGICCMGFAGGFIVGGVVEKNAATIGITDGTQVFGIPPVDLEEMQAAIDATATNQTPIEAPTNKNSQQNNFQSGMLR